MFIFITTMLCTSATAHAAIVAPSKFHDTHDEEQAVDETTKSATSTSDNDDNDDEPFLNTQHDDAVKLNDSEMEGVEDASKYDIMNFVLSKVWGVPSLRKDQVSAIDKLLFDKDADGKMLAVACTGSGKSHILRMVGSMVAGIWLIIVPLLSLTLTADIMA